MFKRNNEYPSSNIKVLFPIKNNKGKKNISLGSLISVFGIYNGILIYNKRIAHCDVLKVPHFILGHPYVKYYDNKLDEVFSKKVQSILNSISKRTHVSLHHHSHTNTVLLSLKPSIPNQRQRYNLIHNNQIIKIRIDYVIKLQTAMRSFVLKLRLKNKIKTGYIIKIQSHFRSYSTKKQVYHYYLIYHILTIRHKSFNTIHNQILQYHNTIQYKTITIYQMIYCYRYNHIVKIQNRYRTHYLSKLVSEIISYEKTQYVLTYPFYAKEVLFKIYLNSNTLNNDKYHYFKVNNSTRQFSFYYCSLRRMFILYINKFEILQGKYRCHFIVDGYVTCDGRYAYMEYPDGKFYNLIEFTNNDEVMDNELEDNSRNTQTDIGTDNSIK